METPGVYVATYNSSEFGVQIAVFASPEGAEKWRQAIAAEWFDMEWPNLEKPTDPAALADAYFIEFNNSHCHKSESFSYEWYQIVD